MNEDIKSVKDDENEKIELIDAIIAEDDENSDIDVDLKELLLNSDLEELHDIIDSVYAIDIAFALEDFEDNEILEFFKRIDYEHMANILEQADENLQKRIVYLLSEKEILAIFNHMSNDDIADILGIIRINKKKELLNLMKKKDTIDIEHLLLYGEDTAGGIMTTEYIALRSHLKAIDTLQKIKEIAPKTEVIETIFVLNSKRELIGTVDLRDIFTANDEDTLYDIMDDNIITVTPDIDQEEVSHLVSKYDLAVVPVINRKNQLLGIITVDDIIDVLVEEQTEDILKLGGVSTDEEDTSIFSSIKARLPWLMVNLLTASLATFVISLFESTTSQVVALTAIMPIVSGMGGNAGTQTLSIVIRRITLNEINLKDDWQKVFKEIFVSILNATVTGTLAGAIMFFRYQNIYLSLIVLLAMIANYMIAAFFGFFIPLILKRFKMDPALASGVFLTATTDTFGFLVFLALASAILPLLI